MLFWVVELICFFLGFWCLTYCLSNLISVPCVLYFLPWNNCGPSVACHNALLHPSWADTNQNWANILFPLGFDDTYLPKILFFSSILCYLGKRETMFFPPFPSLCHSANNQGLIKVLRFAKEVSAMYLMGKIQKEEIRNIGNRARVSWPLQTSNWPAFQMLWQKHKSGFRFVFPWELMAEWCQHIVRAIGPSVMAVI